VSPAPGPTIGGAHAIAVSGSSLYSAAAGYVVLLVAAHRLTPADYAFFLAFWSVLFGGFGIVSGLAAEASRAAYDGADRDRCSPPVRSGRAGILTTGLLFGGIVAAVLAGSAVGWAPLVLGPHWPLALAAALACLFYSGHMTLWGVTSGLQRWRASVAITVVEATARLLALVLVLVLDGGLSALALGSAAPAAAWLLLLLVPALQGHARRRSDVGTPTQLRLDLSAAAASSANAALVVGFPVLVALTSSRADFVASAGLLLAISLTRAPLLVPLTSLQGVALTHFLRHRDRGPAALVPVAALVLTVSAAAAAAAGLVGPALFAFLLDDRYTVSGAVLAALTGSAGLLALLTLTGVCCLALHAHRWYASGWLAATATAVAVLLVPGDLTGRVVVALAAAPVVGVLLHLVGLRSAVRFPRPGRGGSAQPSQHP
jgi:O-antigen/teichoic acid export membrane protein